MAGNTRGKLKEHFEGIHRNYDWILYHCEKSVVLVAGRNPKLTGAIEALAENTKELDKLVQGLYSKI